MVLQTNPASALESGFKNTYFEERWHIDSAEDSDFGSFKARNTYAGDFMGSVIGEELQLEGHVVTFDKNTKKDKGGGRFILRGPINGSQVAAYYTYRNSSVNGFGTAFIQFDDAGYGTMHLVFRVTRPAPGEGNIGAATFHITRENAGRG
jgi:hypothetical protein